MDDHHEEAQPYSLEYWAPSVFVDKDPDAGDWQIVHERGRIVAYCPTKEDGLLVCLALNKSGLEPPPLPYESRPQAPRA